MDAAEVLEAFSLANWVVTPDAATQQRAVSALEAGKVLFFPQLSFALAPAEARFLTPQAADNTRKNISFDPASGRCIGAAIGAEDGAALAAMLDRYGRLSTSFVQALFPGYAAELERARTSFRPVEVEQRPQSVRHDDRRLHVDAFPTRPMRGRRILRVFSNVAPDGEARQWNVGEPFADFAVKFLPRLPPALPGSAGLLKLLGITKGRRSAYDQIMLGLHDAGKRDEAYQRNAPRSAVNFPPGSTWIVYTDQVLHAALAGHFAFEQTFHLPLAALADPERSPVRVLERLTGRALV